jgi:protoporphyrin/coproporphyrin ferrochelatase
MTLAYDALLIVSFGGPEGPDEVIPFLENVLKGRSVPRERMLQVAEHYKLFGGVSPLNQQNRELIASLKKELHERGPDLPIYWGNRNWHPLLADTVQQMRDDGIKQALAFVTSAYSSYSSCRQYRENIAEAQRIVGAEALRIDKLRPFYNHPLFLQANVENIGVALDQVPKPARRATPLIFTAHSIPDAMAMNCMYAQQLQELSELIAAKLNQPFALVYQSRSGSPSQPWLGPDICDFLRTLSEDSVKDVVVAPIGFVSDHMEIVFDLDTQAREVANELGMNMVRAATVGTHPLFIKMIRELILERLEETERESVGTLGALPHVCPVDCCLPAQTRPPR